MASSRETMGREEPPSKKRAALRQIRKEDASDSDDEDGSGAMEGTFRRASDQVLAERRIVKVRRSPLASAGPNPFAGIRLVPPTNPGTVDPVVAPQPNPSNLNSAESKVVVEDALPNSDITAEASAVKPSSEASQSEEVTESTSIAPVPVVEVEKNSVAVGLEVESSEGTSAQNRAEVTDNGKQPTGAVTDVVDAVVNGTDNEKVRGAELIGSSGNSSETFEQLSSAKNAFAGSFGTGFSSSASILNCTSTTSSQMSSGFVFGQPFSFGSQGFGSSVSFGTGQSPAPFGSKPGFQGGFPSVSSIFGKSNGSGASPLFGSVTPALPNPLSAPSKSSVVSLQEVPVETGEEKEKAIFTADAALFEFLDGGWKERGKGELKLNVSEEKDKRPRLVMRSKGNYRLLLNANLFPDMKLSKMDNRGISFVCVNSAAEGRTGLTTYAVKLRDPFAESEFTTTVQAHKGSTNSEPRTPESSPKATERPSKAVETNEIEA